VVNTFNNAGIQMGFEKQGGSTFEIAQGTGSMQGQEGYGGVEEDWDEGMRRLLETLEGGRGEREVEDRAREEMHGMGGEWAGAGVEVDLFGWQGVVV